MNEKVVDRRLSREIERMGGWSIKLVSVHIVGLPDRLCLLPGGNMFFAEIKTTGEKPRKIQLWVHNKIRRLGFRVEVIDNVDKIKEVLSEIT
jgi:hypothetical protein